jgi:hypothetical protein
MLGDVDAVIPAAAVIEHTKRIEVFDRSHAAVRNAGIHLGLRFAEVRVKRLFQRLYHIRKVLEQRIGSRVLRVEAEPVGNERMDLGKAFVFAGGLLRRAAVIVGAADQRGPKPGFDGGLHDVLAEIVHVEHHRDAAGKVLQDREFGQNGDVVRRELAFLGEHLFCQPALQRQIVRKRAQKRHGGVRMRVLNPGRSRLPRQSISRSNGPKEEPSSPRKATALPSTTSSPENSGMRWSSGRIFAFRNLVFIGLF